MTSPSLKLVSSNNYHIPVSEKLQEILIFVDFFCVWKIDDHVREQLNTGEWCTWMFFSVLYAGCIYFMLPSQVVKLRKYYFERELVAAVRWCLFCAATRYCTLCYACALVWVCTYTGTFKAEWEVPARIRNFSILSSVPTVGYCFRLVFLPKRDTFCSRNSSWVFLSQREVGWKK